MSKRKYPCLGGSRPIPARKNKKCQICGEKAAHFVAVQFDFLRGDDEVYQLCQSHKDQMKNDLNRMLDLLPVEEV